MDDALDYETDRVVQRANLCDELQGGVTAYALAAMSLAVLASPAVALSLFAGAYAWGMLGDVRLLPSRLPAFVEGLLLFGLVLSQVGPRLALGGGLIMLAAQLLDDWRDRRLDVMSCQTSLYRLLGSTGSLLAAITTISLAFYVHPVLVAEAAPVFLYFEWREQAVVRNC
jgi:hypothetical protein